MRPFCFRSYRPGFSGYGYGTSEFVKGFERNSYRFTFQPDALERARACREEVVIHSGFPHFYRLEPGKIHIARTMLESDSLPRLWADILNSMDEVWVASSFNVKTFTAGGVDPRKIYVVPDMVDPLFHPPPEKKRSGKRFRFLSVFLDLSLRKGWDVMFYEFSRNFSRNDGVEWVVQCAPESAKKLKAFIREINRRGYDVGNIVVRGEVPSAETLARLYRSADCYVLPTRGEGFGRPYLEAAACGTPVVATGWSGQLDFLDRKNSRLLKYRLKKVPTPEALDCYFLAEQKWAEPDHEDLGAALREMLSRPNLSPVNLAPFRETAVMRLIKERLSTVRKRKEAKREFKPQIILYDKSWKGCQPPPAGFLRKLRTLGKEIPVVGTGRNSRSLSEFLLESGYRIPFYIDRKNGRFLGKQVLSPGELHGIKPGPVILSCFPAAFEEWKGILGDGWDPLPVIFYSFRKD